MPVLQLRNEIGEVTKLIPEERISEKKSPMFLPHDDEAVTVMPKGFGGRKLESTTKDGSDLGDEDEKNKLEELKVIIVIGGDAEYIKKL